MKKHKNQPVHENIEAIDDEPIVQENEQQEDVAIVTSDSTDSEPNKLKRLWRRYLDKKKLTIPLTVIVLVGVLMAIPTTRFMILGTFLSQDFPVVVLDSKNNKPVSGADVSIGNKSGKTDGDGNITLTLASL